LQQLHVKYIFQKTEKNNPEVTVRIFGIVSDHIAVTMSLKNFLMTLEAICDTFSSLLWDVEYYQCGCFEVYIAASPRNIEIFQTGRIVGRDDDKEHFGLIESVKIETDAEDGDYLIVGGRFLKIGTGKLNFQLP